MALTLEVGQSVIYTAHPTDAKGREITAKVAWTVDDTAIVTIEPHPVAPESVEVAALIPGTVKLSAVVLNPDGGPSLIMATDDITVVAAAPTALTLTHGDPVAA